MGDILFIAAEFHQARGLVCSGQSLSRYIISKLFRTSPETNSHPIDVKFALIVANSWGEVKMQPQHMFDFWEKITL